jgi:hypothetical protein
MKRYLALSFLFFYSCNQAEKDVAGVYVKSPLVNTIDSLYFYADGLLPTKAQNRKAYNYIQRFYTKRTGKLLFENKST